MFKYRHREIKQRSDKCFDKAGEMVAEAIVTKTKLSMKTTLTDATKLGRYTFVSAPGAPPSIQTGNLRNSIAKKEKGRFRWLVGTPERYAKALEYGYAPRNLEARPYLRPAMDHAYKRLAQILAKIPKI